MIDHLVERRTQLITGLRHGEAGSALLNYFEEELRTLELSSFSSAEYRLGEISSMRRMIETLRADYAPQPTEEIES